jgi:DNA-binding NarL/FixJ family response regulator
MRSEEVLSSPEVSVRVFLVAANRLLREALARVLRTRGNFHIVEACRPQQGLDAQILAACPDVVLLEGERPSEPDLRFVRSLLRESPELRVVLIAMADHEFTFLDAVRAGVTGYLLQDATAMDVVNAVRAASLGEAVCPPKLCLSLFRSFARQTMRVPSARMRLELGLTRREQQVLPMIAQGMTNKEIALQLHLSEQTVKNHVHRMLHRVGATDRLTAVELVRSQGAYLD